MNWWTSFSFSFSLVLVLLVCFYKFITYNSTNLVSTINVESPRGPLGSPGPGQQGVALAPCHCTHGRRRQGADPRLVRNGFQPPVQLLLKLDHIMDVTDLLWYTIEESCTIYLQCLFSQCTLQNLLKKKSSKSPLIDRTRFRKVQ